MVGYGKLEQTDPIILFIKSRLQQSKM